MIKINKVDANFEAEPLKAPFGFKGSYVSSIWQTAAGMASDGGGKAAGLGTQSPLWSDSGVFASHSESAGNALMFLMTEFALNRAKISGIDGDPAGLMDELFPEVYKYGKKITGSRLRQTFALNALVAVDNAAWILFAEHNGIKNFDGLIPEACMEALPARHSKLASIPLIAYGVGTDEIKKALDEGYFLLKIKIGSDPEKDGDPEKMLDWDMKRLSSIHDIAVDYRTPYTDSGRIPYYLDANGRYDSKDRLLKLLDFADRIGALEDILILEEPFPEEFKADVSDIPVRLAADESAHTDSDAVERIELGYGAVALKPIAKTLSMSFRIAKAARDRNVPCFCADLTVNPVLVDWNKNFAARIPPFPGLKTGLLETNGHQNYLNWEKMKSYHPRHGKKWTEPSGGVFHLDDDFYRASGGIFDESAHYTGLLNL